jgi:oxalate decarboxylase/phosphoglucose isomerase-like protein (cupin superfamily)
VVRGTAEVTCGDKVMLLTENQSTYIPLGEVHRLANPGAIPLEIIEVQSGSYLVKTISSVLKTLWPYEVNAVRYKSAWQGKHNSLMYVMAMTQFLV